MKIEEKLCDELLPSYEISRAVAADAVTQSYIIFDHSK